MNPHDPLPFVELERRLDALGAADARSAPASLEDRLFDASRAALRQPAPNPGVLARIGPGRLRLAAAIALLALGGLFAAAALRSRPAQVSPPALALSLEETLLELASDAVSLAAPVDSWADLQADVASFTTDTSSEWAEIDLSLTEGSM